MSTNNHENNKKQHAGNREKHSQQNQEPKKGDPKDLNAQNKKATKEVHQQEHTGSNKGSIA